MPETHERGFQDIFKQAYLDGQIKLWRLRAPFMKKNI